MTTLSRIAFPLLMIAMSASSVWGAGMEYPLAVAAADNGPVYVADRNLPGVWKITDGKLELLFQLGDARGVSIQRPESARTTRQGRRRNRDGDRF
ncbi:MAG: hypothetical protein NT069_17705 [Planctomycetota bacterium]|nr:hypothetical protein [Planctomycetota bacterium]